MTSENEKKNENKRLPLSLSDLIAQLTESLRDRQKLMLPGLEKDDKELEKEIAETGDITQKNIAILFRKFALTQQRDFIDEEIDLRTLVVIAQEIERLKKKSKRRKVQVTTADQMNELINDAVAQKFAALYDVKGHGAMYD